jgi:hypothetical protein
MKVFVQTLAFIIFSFNCIAQWNSSPIVNTQVETTSGCAADTFATFGKLPLVRDADGNFFTTWSDNRTTPYQVFVQKFNASGQAQWTLNGIKPAASANRQINPEVVADGNGGCFVSWSEEITADNRDIKIQKFNASGTAQWGTSGILVCSFSDFQDISKVINDGTGGVYIAWFDFRGSKSFIYAQRLNGNGIAQWTENGIQVSNTNSSVYYDEFNLLLHNTNAVLVWDELSSPNKLIAAQKLNSSGAKQWGASGISIVAGSEDVIPGIKAVIDVSGNLYIAFLKDLSTANPDVYAQKFNIAGVAQWTSGGVVVCNAPAFQYFPELALDNTGGAFLTWTDDRDNNGISNIYVQRLNSAGTVQFAVNGIKLVTTPDVLRGISKIVADGSGGAIVSFYDSRASPANIDIYSQRINASGSLLWATGGIHTARPVTNYDDAVFHSMVSADNGAVIGFFDNRVSNSGCWDLYLQRINNNGTLGNNPVTGLSDITLQQARLKIYPTVTSGDVMLENDNSYRVTMRVLDITGKEVMNGIVGSNTKQFINLGKLQPGMYIAEIQLSNGKRVTQKLIKQQL